MNKIEKAFETTKTDKRVHQYFLYYDKLFGDEDFKSILEIGVLIGRSLESWQLVWPDAIVEGIDTDLNQAHPSVRESFNLYELSSTDENFDSSVLSQPSYDLIVDDGHHHWSSQRQTFDNFFHLANKFYVIEDLQGVYGLNKVLEYVRKHTNKKIHVFESKGPKVKFNFSNHKEHSTYKIIIIDKR